MMIFADVLKLYNMDNESNTAGTERKLAFFHQKGLRLILNIQWFDYVSRKKKKKIEESWAEQKYFEEENGDNWVVLW